MGSTASPGCCDKTKGLLWYFGHVATCNHQNCKISFCKETTWRLGGRVPPKIFTSWEFYNPRKITWKPKILVSKTNILFQKSHHFQGVTSRNPYMSGFFPRFVGKTHHGFTPKKSQSSHQGVGHKPQAKNQDLHLGVPATPIQDSEGPAFSDHDRIHRIWSFQTAMLGYKNPTKPWDYCWGCIFFTPTIYFSSNIENHLFWKYIEQLRLSIHVQNMRIQFFSYKYIIRSYEQWSELSGKCSWSIILIVAKSSFAWNVEKYYVAHSSPTHPPPKKTKQHTRK